jgi:phosphopantothenoylcysteine synthetase/decarboxylase
MSAESLEPQRPTAATCKLPVVIPEAGPTVPGPEPVEYFTNCSAIWMPVSILMAGVPISFSIFEEFS